MRDMSDVFEIQCPCCQSVLKVDPETKTVLSHREIPKKPIIEDLAAAVQGLKGEAERRSDIFAKSFDAHLNSAKTREKRFEELLKEAKESPDEAPPKRAFDFD
jgi:hypothetical protein